LPAPIHQLANSNEDNRGRSIQSELLAERREVWNGDNLTNKVSAYGMIEPFTGITDLTNEQLDKLREILNTVSDVDVLKKNKRASDLVKEWITEKEWKELTTEHKVTIYSKLDKRRSFVIHEDPSRKVDVYEKNPKGEQKLKFRICGITANSNFADGDKVLNKIIAIKTDEHEYIRTSNVYNER
jgi:hypothetical protein